MKRNNIQADIMECLKLMRTPIILNALTEVLTSTLLVVIANYLGQFAEAALDLDFEYGLRNIWILIGCFLMSVLVAPLFGLIGDFIMMKQALKHDNVVFSHFLDQEPDIAMNLRNGKTQYELEDAPNELRIQMVILLSKSIALPFCLGYLLFCIGRINWMLTGILFLLAALRLIPSIFFRKKLAMYDANEKSFFAERKEYEMDVITNPHVIKLWGIVKPIHNRIYCHFLKYYKEVGRKKCACNAFATQSNIFVDSFSQILLFVIGAIMVAEKYISPGEFASTLVYLSVAQTILESIRIVIQNYPLMLNAAKRVSAFYSHPEVQTEKSINGFKEMKGYGIRFAYKDKSLLNGLDFEIMQKEKIAITGENGSGKSTLGKIITALIKRYDGRIMVNGYDIKDIDPVSLRETIAYAPQIPYLFETTVRENVRMGDLNAEEDEINDILDEFGILSLADRMVSMGSNVSGGERQKISLARALLKKADLLILDEPTNHLDQRSIQVLKRHITETCQTVLIISHDPALLEITKKQIDI